MVTSNDARGKASGIKIIGIGQFMRGDDAAGLYAVRQWQEQFGDNSARPHIEVELAELPGIGLLNLIDGMKVVILVDAVRSGSRAGTIHLVSEEQLDTFANGSGSAHGLGVAETLALGRRVLPSQMPERLILIGIEAGDISLGETLSREVEMALPEAARLIEQMLVDALRAA